MKRNNIAISFEKQVLDSLVLEENSRVEVQERNYHLALHPFHLNNINESLRNIFNKNIAKYDKKLNGILLGYQNIKLISHAGAITNDSCFIHVDITADFYLFKPNLGNILIGTVNKRSSEHLGCLVHKTFNVSLPKPKDEENDDWIGSKVEIGTDVSFVITFLNLEARLPYIRGELVSVLCENDSGISTSEENMGKRANTKIIFHSHSENEDETEPPKSKKRKKRKSEHEPESDEEVEVKRKKLEYEEQEEEDERVEVPKKKKKKKHKSADFSEIQDHFLDEADCVLEETCKRKKSKHKKRSKIEEEPESHIQEKSKQKHEELIDFNMEGLNNAEEDMLGYKQHHGKKKKSKRKRQLSENNMEGSDVNQEYQIQDEELQQKVEHKKSKHKYGNSSEAEEESTKRKKRKKGTEFI